MPFLLTMPKLSPTMESGTIVKWHKKEGDQVAIGDVLLEVATDKATVEYQAIDGGWMRKILINEGQEAAVNDPVAIFTEKQNESIENFSLPEQKQSKEVETAVPKTAVTQEKKVEGATLKQPAFVPEPPLEGYEFGFPTQTIEKRLFASPLAKKVAQEKGLDLTSVKGSGPQGRIMSHDLETAQVSGLSNFSQRQLPTEVPGSYEEIPLSPIRKVVGQRLQESKSFIPHFYIRQEVHVDALVALREQLKSGEIKVSINDLIVRACALVLRKHPKVNRGFNSTTQKIIQFKTIDFAIAVSMPEGLITPIVRHADFKNLGELSVEIKLLAQRARAGELEPQEYKGGSFTISNLGMYGVTDFQAIINPPQAAILAVGGIKEVPIVDNGAIKIGKTLNLVLSVDHRVIDGSDAADFLKTLKKYLENPVLLLVK